MATASFFISISFISISAIFCSGKKPLELGYTSGARERQHIADVRNAGEVHHQALKADAEPGVLVAAKTAQVQVCLLYTSRCV